MRNRRVRRKSAGRPALIEGLSRLEHRGYDSAGVAVLGQGSASRSPSSRAGCATSRSRCRSASRARSASATPGGPPTARPTTSTRTRTSTARAWWRSCTRDHRQRRGTAGELSDDGVDLASDTDTEVLAHLVARSAPTPSRAGRRGAGRDRRHLRARRHTPTSGPDRRRPQRQPADHRRRRQGDVCRLELAALVRYTTIVAHLDDGELATITATGFTTFFPTARRPTGPRRCSRSTPPSTTPATTSPTCTRRCSSSRLPPSARCAAGSTNASAPVTSAASTWTPARPARSSA